MSVPFARPARPDHPSNLPVATELHRTDTRGSAPCRTIWLTRLKGTNTVLPEDDTTNLFTGDVGRAMVKPQR